MQCLQEFTNRVTDGTRTRDVQDHNLALYQLSYGHQTEPIFYRPDLTVNTRKYTSATGFDKDDTP